MNKEVIQAIVGFMQRCTLSPSEIEAFNQCMKLLQEAHASAPSQDAEAPQFEEVIEA
jgi:hypothetical protein